jgi:hypothetical protein
MPMRRLPSRHYALGGIHSKAQEDMQTNLSQNIYSKLENKLLSASDSVGWENTPSRSAV